ncbi:MAG: DUF362 domain-containing protein [Anaerolineaceae bacterium]|nr:DUF362 domain-containing protein [Anaerolineaceae bacterium]
MAEQSKVYFTNLRVRPGMNLLQKLEKLMRKAGIEQIDFKEQFVAIKIHFGEPGNLAYIRPNYAAQVVRLVRELGGRPFLTDANTLYTGRRANAVDHLESAMENGFNRMAVGCDVIIADGLKGTDYREVFINQKHCKTAKIGTAIADADIVISMSHFKGHEMTGFGGALKNLGMGSGSRGGKMEMHSASKPVIVLENCVGCRMCVRSCPEEAITMNADKKAVIDYALCIGCGQCVAVCQYDSAQVKWDAAADSASEKIAEYTLAVIQGKPNFHINFIMNVSPDCDCWNNNDQAIVQDLGIMASFDPVALDRASVDMVNQTTALPGSRLEEKGFQEGEDKFGALHGDVRWSAGLDYAEEIGLGTQNYELIEV